MRSELDLSKENAKETTLAGLKAKIAELKAEKAKLEIRYGEYAKLKAETAKLKNENTKFLKRIIEKYAKYEADIAKLKIGLQYPVLEHIKPPCDCLWQENRKFQAKCIQIAEEILNEKPIIEISSLSPSKYRIALEVQGSQHRFHNTGWYKDVKKLEPLSEKRKKMHMSR
ncbi:18740_t:CDS:2 [Gigaspora margarita]|uniref:18740_t:CDS:1 n=1 Tax=Gigaspora margarita TaxID=4874 RepID=A0ABN7VZ80_GIGMA|nr:18740_t:CDS:2 [Gigaspora margarita]